MIDLSLNESPYPPTELLGRALTEAAARVHRYPREAQQQILERVASHLELEPEQVRGQFGYTGQYQIESMNHLIPP